MIFFHGRALELATSVYGNRCIYDNIKYIDFALDVVQDFRDVSEIDYRTIVFLFAVFDLSDLSKEDVHSYGIPENVVNTIWNLRYNGRNMGDRRRALLDDNKAVVAQMVINMKKFVIVGNKNYCEAIRNPR